MLVHPQFNPVALDLKFFQIHWYGLTYLVAFGQFYWLACRRALRWPFADRGWTARDVEDLLFFGVLGVILGGRIGFILFYNLPHYLAHPLEVFAVWKGGMAFHGGLMGVFVAMAVFARSRGRTLFEVTDLIVPCVPLGLASGRVGNFINGELPGRVADPTLPWAMVFPQSGSMVPRHPSPIYQLLMEGLLLFVLLWWYARRRAPYEAAQTTVVGAGAISVEPVWGRVSGAFLFGYGVFRFIAEFFREPDAQLGLLALGMSMGQWLCVPMLVLGALIWWQAGRRR